MTFAKLQCSKEIEETVIKTDTGTWILSGSPAVPSSVFGSLSFWPQCLNAQHRAFYLTLTNFEEKEERFIK